MKLPRWATVLAVLILTAACCCIAFTAVRRSALTAEMADTQVKLNTSRQRELKQQSEYDAVAEALPQKQAELAELQPQADEAAAEETELRALRKEGRAVYTGLQSELQTAEDAAAEALAQREELLLAAEEALSDAEAALGGE